MKYMVEREESEILITNFKIQDKKTSYWNEIK